MLKYQTNIQQPADAMKKVSAIAFSPNLEKLAVANSNNTILLFDQNYKKRDKIPTRGAKKGDVNYIIRAIAFSPDSSILAVAQSDNIIYGFRLGSTWGEKKSICTKIQTTHSITCLIWPKEKVHELFFGMANGQIKIGFVKNHKSSTLFSTNSYAVSIDSGKNGKYLVTGHLDGSIYLYNLESSTYKKLITAATVPYALSFGKQIVFAGNDNKVTFLNTTGNITQKFEYENEKDLRDFTGAFFNSVGETVVLLNYSQFLIINYNSKRQEWEDKGFFKIGNYYSISAGAWKPDGTKFAIGNLCGSVDLFEISLKKMKFKGKFELNYVSNSKIKILSLEKGSESLIESKRELEILKIDIIKDKFVIAETNSTLLLGNLEEKKCSEIEWNGSGNEKFEFGKEVCWVANAGEVSVIEFGKDEIIGTFRTEYISHKLISGMSKNDKKFIAYLLDLHTISVLNLTSKITEATIDHDSKIVFLSFNTNANKILFKDKKKALFLFNLISHEKQTLLNYCSFCKWVPNSDVIVAQSKSALEIWYSSDSPDKKTTIPLKGTAIGIKTGKSISITVLENHVQKNIELDDLLIKFGFAIENKDLSKCIQILEEKKEQENEGHWKTLLDMALEIENYFIVERCYVALGDVSKARFLRRINKIIRKLFSQNLTKEQVLNNFEVKAQLAIMNKQFTKAEQIYLEQQEPQKAIELYQNIHKWEESLRVAEKINTENYKELKEKYFNWLLQTGQDEKAAELKEKDGEFEKALELYLKTGLPVRAANIVLQQHMQENEEIVQRILKILKENENHSKLGELYQQFGDNTKALNFYIKGEKFSKAVQLAKKAQPDLVTKLHEKWGEFLMSQNEKESAINHFIEAGQNKKAIEAAISAQQWNKAISLLNSFSSNDLISFSLKIAEKLKENKHFDLAEKFFVKGEQKEKVIQMHIENRQLKNALNFAQENYSPAEIEPIFLQYGKETEEKKEFDFAEKIYIEIKKPELAIKMHKNREDWEKMLKLFQIYRPENLKEANVLIGRKMEEREQLQNAEKNYIEGGKWVLAVEMYEKRKKFEDCLRICKSHASDRDTVERAKRWEGLIEEQELIKLLQKMYLTDSLIDFLCEKKKFQEAFKLAQNSKHKLSDVYLSQAMFFEDEKRFKEAEENYILAGKFDQAVNMYLDQEDYQNALRIATQHEQNLTFQIYTQWGNALKQQKDFVKMENCYINARKPELAIQSYLQEKNYSEALRVAKKHRPDLVSQISANMDRGGNFEGMNGEEMIQQGKMWEDNREWERAVETYLEINPELLNQEKMVEVYKRVIFIGMNFLKNKYMDFVKIVCKRLRDLTCFDLAGEYYREIEYFEEACKCFIQASQFDKAKNCLQLIKDKQIEEELRKLFNENYNKFLKEKGDAEKLVGNSEVSEGLEIMIQRGDWIQVFSIAKTKEKELFIHYLSRYIKENLDNNKYKEVINTLSKFGMPNSQSLNPLYKKLITQSLKSNDQQEILLLKEVLKNLVTENESEIDKEYKEFFKKALFIAHLLGLREIYQQHGILELLELIQLSLTRFGDLLGIDKVFLQTGKLLKKLNKEGESFLFLNRYLDIYEAIMDSEGNNLEDNEEFRKTDFPQLQNIELPKQNLINEEEKNLIRDWLLKITVDKTSELKLRTKQCISCFQEIFFNNIQCPFCNYEQQKCFLTGSPIEKNDLTNCKHCGSSFGKNNLAVFLKYFDSCPWCSDLLQVKFIY